MTDVDRVTGFVHVWIDDRHGVGGLTLFLILHHRDGRVRPLVPPLVALAVCRRIFLRAIGEVDATQS
ncbi:MAG: hypothetical protein HOJ66_04035, partial [Acidiferrobacteraceae bacterium]|nr:hypothetical protein [Acidiferrobacteraceae bacterium]